MADLERFFGDYGSEVQCHFDAIEAEDVTLIKGVLGDWPDCVARPYCLADWNVRDSSHLCGFLGVGPPHHCSGYTPKEVKIGGA